MSDPTYLRFDFTVRVNNDNHNNNEVSFVLMEIEGFEPYLEFSERSNLYGIDYVLKYC